jgi:hypothetical protein
MIGAILLATALKGLVYSAGLGYLVFFGFILLDIVNFYRQDFGIEREQI